MIKLSNTDPKKSTFKYLRNRTFRIMPTTKEKVMLGVGSTAGLSLAAWRTFFPWIGYDIAALRISKKNAKRIQEDIANGRFLIDLFEKSVNANLKKPFIIFEDRIYTYEYMNEQACKVANIAMKLGLKIGDTVAILIFNEPAFIYTFLGLLKLGITVAFLNTNNRHKPLLHSIQTCEAKILIVGQGEELYQAVEDINTEINIPVYLMGTLSSEMIVGYQSWNQLMLRTPPAEVSRSVRTGLNLVSPCCFIYTSGTTGLPKPAIITQARALNFSKFLHLASIVPEDIVYTVIPLYHTAAWLALCTVMDCGSTLVLKTKFSAQHFFDDCRRYNVTIIQYIGELCRYLMALPESPKDSAHKIRAAIGNGLRKDIWEKFQKRFNIKNIVEFFGATEGPGTLFTINGKAGAIGRMSPIYKRTRPVDIAIIRYDSLHEAPYRDKNNRCVPVEFGEPGLFISGIPPTFVNGFYKGAKELNEKKIIRNVFKNGDSYFNFGDLLYMDKDYFVYFQDRIGDTYRWKGENVSTNEVANVITGIDFVHDANVYGVQIPGYDGRAGMVALHLTDNEKLNAERLKKIYDHCVDNLPSYARPLFIRLEEDTRVTSTFKQHKVDLVKEGFDPREISDPLFYLSRDAKTYLPLNTNAHANILKSRL